MAQKTLRLLLLPALLCGCSSGGSGDDGGTMDAEEIQVGDDGGATGDHGGDQSDYDHATPVELNLEVIDSWRRGPVRVGYTLSGPRGKTAELLFAYSTDGRTFHPATALAGYAREISDLPLDPGGVFGAFVWDSKRDIPDDAAAVTLRGTPLLDDGEHPPAITGPFELLNSADRHRPVVVAHPYDTSANPGNLASVLRLGPDGALEDTGANLDCGPAPVLAAFTADGRYGVVLGRGSGGNHHNLAPFAVGRDGKLARIGAVIDIRELGFFGGNLEPAPDGSGIWLVHYNGEGGLFFLSFEEGRPRVKPAEPSGYNQLPMTLPASMAILPDNRRALISGGALAIDNPPFDVTLADLSSGAILEQRVMGVGSLAEKVAVTPDGTRALIPAADPWGAGNHRLMVLSLDGEGIRSWLDVPVPYPSWVAVHPQGGAALVTSWDRNCLAVVNLSADPPVVTQIVSSVPLADHLDCVCEGSLAGLCLVSAVTDLAVIWLESDSTASRCPSFSFGDGMENITSGPAIQP